MRMHVEHRELDLMLCCSLNGRSPKRRGYVDTHILVDGWFILPYKRN